MKWLFGEGVLRMILVYRFIPSVNKIFARTYVPCETAVIVLFGFNWKPDDIIFIDIVF